MAEELGKIEKPEAGKYKEGRKLFFAPLIFTPRKLPADLEGLVESYWKQVEEQVSKLEASLSDVKKIFHELIPVGGKEGLKAMKELNNESYRFANASLRKGAELQPVEDSQLLTEFMDWSRCLVIGLQNHKVLTKVYEFFSEAGSRRNEYIAQHIDETLKRDETGILLMREGHQVQFPSDIEIFYVAPPALDEIKRWLRNRESTLIEDSDAEEQGDKE